MAHLPLSDWQAIEKILADDAVRAAATLSIGEDVDSVLVRLRDALDAIATPAVRQAANMCVDDIEIDDDAGTSPSDDGTWVQAWVWVSYPDCEVCGGSGKDEQDQYCPDCGGTGRGTIG